MHSTKRDAHGEESEAGVGPSSSNFDREPDVHISDGDDEAWQRFNILSLDGGGIRGYWTLLTLQKLMEFIAEEEEKEDEDTTFHSFSPQSWPSHVSPAPLTPDEKTRVDEAEGEEAKARALPKARRYLPCHYFDNICGSSTGALIAIMLGRFRMTVPDCIHEYKSLAQEVFGKPRFFTSINFGISNRHKYRAANLTKVVEEVTKRRDEKTDGEVYGKITFPSRRGLCTTFVTTRRSQYKDVVGKEYLIRSYDHDKTTEPNPCIMPNPKTTKGPIRAHTAKSTMSAGQRTRQREKATRTLNYEKAQKFEIWQVARAATAAPWYFEPLEVEKARTSGHIYFTDGGFSHNNNPTRQGQLEIEELHGPDSIGIVVSVGTARKENVNKGSRWRHFVDKIPREIKGMAHNLSNPEQVHEDMQKEQEKQGFTYFRLNHKDGLNIELDRWEPKQGWFNPPAGSKTISFIDNAFGQWACDIATINDLKNCAEILVECRRKRIYTPKWERFATGARYRCRRHRCGLNVFEGDKFKAHLKKEHNIPEQELESEMEYCKDRWQYQDSTNLHAH